MSVKVFKALFSKVGGWTLFRQYSYAGVLTFAVWQILVHGFSKKGLEIARLAINKRIVDKLRRKNKAHIATFLSDNPDIETYPRAHSKKVWVCWLQGIEAAPLLVKRCCQSLKENMPDREIVLLTEDSWKDYVSLPPHIIEKMEKGYITRTHFSDFLRLELLLNYGGTWIDATVFCSGNKIPSYMLDSDFFIFQCMKPGLDGHPTRTSSWFISACTNQPILMLTKYLLYKYWESHNKMYDYFLIHDFIELSIETFPEEWKKVVPFSNAVPHILLLRLFEQYDKQIWAAAKEQTPFHKLSYKFTSDRYEMEGTYYKHVIEKA
ncbi:MAG: capsular polysaccharide synthesis protein [Prevotella sp.]|nr:capsular polysaccharide synthesis protein [Prevotella sp.]